MVTSISRVKASSASVLGNLKTPVIVSVFNNLFYVPRRIQLKVILFVPGRVWVHVVQIDIFNTAMIVDNAFLNIR